jgi:hypothetical protein
MKRVLLTTLFALLWAFIFTLVLFSIESVEMGIYAATMIIGISFIPVLVAVLLFQLIRKRIVANSTLPFIIQILLMILIMSVGLILWSVADAIPDFSLENVVEDFHSQFLGFTPLALSLAIAIPAIDKLIDKIDKKANKKHLI